jgi:hypothetical protein
MSRVATGAAGLLALALLAGCGRQDTDAGYAGAAAEMAPMAPPSAPDAALQAPQGTALAYESEVALRLPAEAIGARIDAVQQACQQAKFGDCAVLGASREGGPRPGGRIVLRIAPAGVEPILKLAGEGGELASRSTHAEDLAQQVADTRMTQDRLEKEHARLLAFQQRSDLKVADLLALSQRLAEIEAQAEQARRDAGQQRRRIDTQLVTIDYTATGGEQRRSAVGSALSDSGQIFADSVAFLIRLVAGLLPAALGALLLVGLLRWWWRRRRRR